MSTIQSKSWREDKQGGFNLLFRQSCIVSCFGVASAISHYYLYKYRMDLPKLQQKALTLCHVLYTARVALQMFYLQSQRTIPNHELLAFPFMSILYLLPIYFAKKKKNKMNYELIDFLSFTLSFVGHFFTIGSEFQRKCFKSKEENKGQLFTEGLNSLTRHPNYFGECLLFTGWTLFSNEPKMLLLPASMVVQFYAYVIPEIEGYLKQKYAAQWPNYARNVKALIPFVY